MPRLFFAIDVPREVYDALKPLRRDDMNWRWTKPEQLHLTLRFLREVQEEGINSLIQHVEQEERPEPFDIFAEGRAVFPSNRRPRVLVERLRSSDPLMRLQRMTESAAQRAGFPPEERRYTPHLTLARIKNTPPRDVRAYINRHRTVELSSFTATAYHLYESNLQPTGAVHYIRVSWPLDG